MGLVSKQSHQSHFIFTLGIIIDSLFHMVTENLKHGYIVQMYILAKPCQLRTPECIVSHVCSILMNYANWRQLASCYSYLPCLYQTSWHEKPCITVWILPSLLGIGISIKNSFKHLVIHCIASLQSTSTSTSMAILLLAIFLMVLLLAVEDTHIMTYIYI